MNRKAMCQYCGKLTDYGDLLWTYDNYGIPFKLVCCVCHKQVEEHISNWEFDPSTGEHLEDY